MNLIRNFVLQDLHAVLMICIHRVVIMRDLCYCTRKVGNYISGSKNLQFLLKNYQKQLSKLLVELLIRWFFYRMERLFDDFLVRYYRYFLYYYYYYYLICLVMKYHFAGICLGFQLLWSVSR